MRADTRCAVKILLLGGALALALACRTTETRSVSSERTPLVRVGTRARTWEVRCGGELLGLVVSFQERGLARDSLYFVRNPWNQDLGLIDGLGRAYRYLPHREEPSWVGTGTITAGAERILDAAAPCELVEVGPLGEPGPGSEAANAIEASRHDPLPAADSPHSEAPPPDEGLPQSR